MAHRLVVGVFLCLLSLVSAASQGQTVTFVDAQGAPAATLLDGDTVRVRVLDPGANTSPARDSATVTVTSDLAADSESLTLLETGPGTGIFEGGVKLYPAGSYAPPVTPALATATSSGGPPSRDTLHAAYPANGATATAGLAGSILQFVDEWGRESATFVPGQPVRLRVRDQLRNQPTFPSSFGVTVTSAAGSLETVVWETASPGVFEGVFATRTVGGSVDQLLVQVPDLITATVASADGVTSASAQAQIAGSQIALLGSDGEPVDAFLEGERVRVRVTDPSVLSYSVGVEVTASLTGDSETLTLIKTTGPVFEGEIPTRLISYGSPSPGDGILQITETSAPATDTVTASYAEGPGAPSASKGFVTGRISFVDAEGKPASSYAVDTEVHVRYENQVENTPALDWHTVTISNLTLGGEAYLTLVETRHDSGVFTGSMRLGGGVSPEGPRLSAESGDQLRVRSGSAVSEALSTQAFAEVSAGLLWFVDEWGEPTDEIVESAPARVRMLNGSENSNPGSAQSVTVEMRARLTGDLEPLALTETGPDTGVFEASIPMEMSTFSQPDGTLQTANSGQPDYHQDEVMARSGQVEAVARTVGARIDFVDALGQRVDRYVLGEPVRVRIFDPYRPPGYNLTVSVMSRETGDVEWITLQRTAPGSNVFVGSIATGGSGSGNGTLGVAPGGQVEVRHMTGFSPIEIVKRAEILGSAVRFIDAAGQPAAVYLESSRAYVRVLSAGSNIGPLAVEGVQVQLRADLSQDWETLTLLETGPNTGIFESSIQLRLTGSHSSPPLVGNGVLETTEMEGSYGVPPRFDTLRATFIDGTRTVAAEAGLTGSRVWFADAAGAEVLEYPIGGRAYVRVEDHNANSTPEVVNYVIVQMRSTVTGDLESLELLETGQDTGIFTGSLLLPPAGGPTSDGALQVQPGELIEAWHEDLNGATASSAAALIQDSSLEIVDEQGEPTDTVLQGGEVRVRLFSYFGNSNPAQTESVTIQLQSLYGQDSKTLELTETGPGTGLFEGALPLSTYYGSGSPGALVTSYSPYPESLEDRVTASYGPVSDQARVVGARIVLLDAFGRETTAYAAGEAVRVRVEDHARNSSPTSQDSAYVDVSSSTGDRDNLQLQETGFDTSVFVGSIPTALSGGALYNGQLLVAGGGTVQAEIYPYGAGNTIVAQASVTGNAVRFLDAAGQPAAVYLEGSRAYLRVISAAGNTSSSSVQTVTVELVSELVGDTELVTLTETGPGTAVFEGSIPLRLTNAAFLGDGILQTYEVGGPPHRFDTLRATFQDAVDTSVARIGLTGSRTWFIDAAGNETLSYPAGGTARLRVEAPSRNNAGQYDFTNVRVRSLVNNDVEVVQLQETARDSGIFTGSLPLSIDYNAVAIDGLLRVQPGEQIEAEHEDLLGFTASSAVADIADLSIEIFDGRDGTPGVLVEKGSARVRVFSLFDNSNPGQADSLTVELSSRYGSDTETLTLTETGPDTDTFEGTLPLDNDFNSDFPGSLRTSYGPYPESVEDRVTASYGPASAQARVVGSSIVFLDAFGRETTAYAAGESVRVRVVDHNRNSSTTSFDTAYIDLAASTGDNESFQLQETGYNTAVFEGSMPAVLSGGAGFNSELLVAAGGTVEARIYPYGANGFITARAAITGNAVRFVDAAGQPASSYLESSRAYLQVTSVTRNTSASTVQTVTVQLSTELGSDEELVTLTETGANTGIFRGSIALRLSASVSPGDGVLQTHQVGGPPHEYDTLRATYADPAGTSVARIGLTGSRVWFVDATGAEVSSYPVGGTVRVRVEDQNLNTPGQWDFLPIRVRSLTTQDEEVVQLQETSRDSGIFAGSLPLAATGPQSIGDGRLLAQAGERIEAVHDEVILQSTATAVIEDLAIQFVDAAGEPIETLLTKGTARVRVFSVFDSFSLTVELSSVYGSDTETLTLTETGAGTHVFEGTLPLDDDFNSDLPGSLRTSYGPYPERLEDRVTASYGPVSAEARVVGASLVFLDAYGRETTAYAAGESVRVRVVDHNRNSSTTSFDTAYIDLTSSTGDNESFQLQETGYNTSVFEGSMPTVLTGGATSDSQLLVAPGGTVQARIYPYGAEGQITVQAAIDGNAVLFVDAAGQPASSYLESSRAYLRVISATRNTSASSVQTVSVQLNNELGGDSELVTLTETGVDTGVFAGSIALRMGSTPAPGDGILQTQQLAGPPHEYDTLRATYSDPAGTSMARIGLTGSRVWFVDFTGAEVSSYPVGGTVRVRVEDQNRNTPGQWDFVPIRVRSLTTQDEEVVQLQETSRDSGVFAGSLPLAPTGPQSIGDGRLLAQAGERIEAVYDEVILQSTTTAVIENLAIQLIDAAGEPTGTLLTRGEARVRVFSVFNSSSLTIELRSLYGSDTETLTLNETGAGTHVFEGTLPLDDDFNSDLPGSLRTSYGPYPEKLEDRVTASYGPVSVEARVVGSSLVFLDAYGRETTAYAAGETVRVRVVDHNRNSSPASVDTAYVDLTSSTGDNESFQLQETGYDTAVFEGSMPAVLSGGATSNEQLLVAPGGTVEARIYPYGAEGQITARAAITGNAVRFVDASGQPAGVYLESSRAYLQVTSATRNTSASTVETVSVQLNNELGADSELVTLTETGVDTGVFAGSIALRMGSTSTPDDGVLQTHQVSGPPHEFDTLRATYSDPSGTSVARIGLTGSRLWFVDAAGVEALSFAANATVRVRVEDHNFDTPGAIDQIPVRVRSLTTLDEEVVTLTETGTDTGLFAGSLRLSVSGSAALGDGRLLVQPGEQIEAEHEDAGGFTASSAVADVTEEGVPENQEPTPVADTATTLEDEAVTVNVLANDTDPDQGDALDVVAITQPAIGAAVLEANGTVTYTPPANANGEAVFSYTVRDPGGLEATAPVTITITPVNDAPLALADAASVAEDGSVDIAVLGNDSDLDGDPLDVTAVTQGARGTVTLNADDTVTYAPSANFAGTDAFTYTISDGNGGTATATVTVTVAGDNDAPTASPDSATVAEDGSVSIAVLTNDSDPDDDALDVTAVTQGAHGTVTIEADSTLTYEPAADYHGTDSFTYTINDGSGGSGGTALGVVSLTVTPVNDDPAAADDQASGSEDGTVAIAVLGNDSDADDDPLTIASATQGANGSVTLQGIAPDQTVLYTPAANFHGTDSFTYTIEDGHGGTATATVTVSIGSENDSPAAVADSATVSEDGAVVVTVLGNDTDPENDTLDVLSVTLGANGTAAVNADETVTYTPDADFHGTDSFTYTIGDGNGGTATATVTVTVTSVNDTPVANADAASVAEDGSVSVAVLTNDDDADGDPLTVTAVTQGANGSVTVQADQTLLYTPNANFNGTDSFTYTVEDGNGGTATASVAITVTSGNDGPVASPDTATVAEDGAVTVSVLTNDSDPESDPLQVTSVTQGADGTVTINGGTTVTYTPEANFHGSDSFTYTIEDGNGGTATTAVTVTVTPVNDLPVANADAGSVAEDGAVSIGVLTNDDDADGDTLSVTAVTQGANGSAAVNPDKTITYTPNPNFQGSDVFTYTVSDGNGGTATASVAITVTAVNDAPVANPNSATTPEDTPAVIAVLANDTDADGDTLQVASVTQGTKGAVAINPDRTVTYTPNANVSGSDSFTYTVSDGNGGTATAAVALTITAVNDAPVAVNDTAATTAEVLVNVTVLGNDVDVDSPSLTVTSVTQPAHGTTVVNADQTLRYTPASGYKGSDAFTYTVADGAGGTATATVTMTVNAPPRVTGNLQVLYNLNEGSGSTVTDTSGTGAPLNLTVANPSAVSWISGGLSVNSATLIQSAGAATKVITACQSSNAITIEAWVAPDNTSQTGPAPLVSISQASNKRNVTFGQSANRWEGRLRTTSTNQAGNTVQTAAGTVSTALSHVVYTRDAAGNIRIYVNGIQSTSSTLAGNFSGWTTSYKLGLVNELSTGSPWLGDLYLVAIYSRALSATEVRQNWLAGE